MDPKTLSYTKTHEWIEPDGARRKAGITHFAAEQLGDIVYIEMPEGEKQVAAGDEVCVIESCKATASVYAPMAGKVVAFNTALVDAPEKINQDPYGDGWLYQIEPDAGTDAPALLDAAAYEKFCAEEA
jgi:glycine cleavage system H protein